MARRIAPEAIALAVLAIGHVALVGSYAGRLPLMVPSFSRASHGSRPMTSPVAAMVEMLVWGGLTLGSILLVAAMLAKTPEVWARMPHRDEWLSPEHRAEAGWLLRRHALRVGLVVQGLSLLLARGMLEMDRTGSDRLDLRGLPIFFVAMALIAVIIATMRRPFLATPSEAGR